MTLTRGIVLPSTPAVGGGILAQADPLPPGWERGVGFATEACIAAGEHVFCPDSPTEKNFGGTTLSEFNAYGIEVGVVCTTLGGTRDRGEREARAFQALEVVSEYSVGYVLATGTTQAGTDTGNPALVDATDLGAEDDEVSALAVLEDSIAENLRGHLAWIHVTPSTLVELVACNSVRWDEIDQVYRSPSGHVVVASPGYVGNIDNELVASTPVFASRGSIELMRTVDRADNRYLAIHEAAALAIFDPCFLVSVSVEDSPSSP